MKYGRRSGTGDEDPAAGQKPLPTFEEARAAGIARICGRAIVPARAQIREVPPRSSDTGTQMEEQLAELAGSAIAAMRRRWRACS